jgi:Fur family zinc uptake transcriptional regulator
MSIQPNIIGFEQHNHNHCINKALQEAKSICQQKALRLTPLREQVLTYLWQSHRPLGAYAIMDMLAKDSPQAAGSDGKSRHAATPFGL